MRPTQATYPVFEANQVLTNAHLNQVFTYLDEQERLTRANLIGIGIVCGLEIKLDSTAGAAVIHLTKGCGVTSQGYLLVEPDDVKLVAYRAEYKVPNELEYRPFQDPVSNTQYPLWELFPAGEPHTTLLDTPTNFLGDKAVLLFLELKKEGLRNCSPNNCDDRGAEVKATVRRLLIQVADLTKIMAAANKLGAGLTATDVHSALQGRLALPDLRLPRYDVPNTGPATTHQVLGGFLEVFRREKLAQTLGVALTAAYTAFRPLVEDKYPTNPFTGFGATFGFLDTAPTTTSQVRFLPYYYDFFDDLLAAYEEFRWKGAELLCACCPPSELFPRHLMLGALQPASVTNAALYRQPFLSSAALSGCEEESKVVSSLFQRLVEMVAQFTTNPPLPKAATNSRVDRHIRITPSKLAAGPISDKAIPYYYQQTGEPPLYQVWSPQKTRRGRANQNLSYRADEYSPAPPAFVLQPLGYDLEPHNFLRVEGHLGKNYQSVLTTLLGLKTRHRLPIDIIALRTGAFDANMSVDLREADCRFQDLETLYDTLRAELTCFLGKQTQYFYDLPFERRTKITTPAQPKLPLLVQCAPDFLVQPQTLGRFFEDWYSNLPAGALPELDPSVIINFLNTQHAGQSNTIIFYLLVYITKFYEQLTADLRQLQFARLEQRHQDLASVTEAIEREREEATANLEGNAALLRWEELDDRLEDILYNCRLEAFRALLTEYQRRLTELKQKQFLSYFLQQNPGIQHKAGVPLGGTFIVVYHDDPDQRRPGLGLRRFDLTNLPATAFTAAAASLAEAGSLNSQAVAEALGRISANKELAVDEDVRFIIGTLTGMAPNLSAVAPPAPHDEAAKVIAAAVNELADGTVIADFFLPYLCCSDCAPVQFVLPKAPPTFTVQLGCTNPNNEAEVRVTPEGGLPPYSIQLDTQAYRPLSGALLVSAGSHTLTLRDAEAVESAPQTIVIAPQLRLLEPTFDCVGDNNEYVASLQISGGTPPYSANRGTIDGTTYLSDALPGDTETEILIIDSLHCTAIQRVQHSCRQPLAFTTKVSCTTANKEAAVDITPTGGTAPYQVQVNDDEFAPLHGLVTLPVGAHSLILRDAAGATTEAQRLEIAPPLLLQETDFICEGTAYRSFIRVEGGTPPYLMNGAPITGDTIVTEPMASGTATSIEVEDQQGCKATVEVKHSCEQPCNLPCDGQSRRGAYRLWLQPPVEGASYEAYRQDAEVKLRFNDKDFTLEGAATVIQIPTGQLNGNFRHAIGGAIKKLNERIKQALVAEFGEELGANRLVLSYEPAATDPFGILWIEHFVCERFSLELPFSFAKPTPAFSLLMRYTNEPDVTGAPFNGAILINRRLNNKETRVPAFDNRERNQCTGREYQQLCEGPDPKPAISIDRRANNGGFVFTGKIENAPQESITAWVWDVFIAQPTEPFYQGREVEAQLQKPGGAVRLTAITDKGCFGHIEQAIP